MVLTVEKVAAATFSKRLHPATRIIYPLTADKFHTCRARSVFSHAAAFEKYAYGIFLA